MSLRGRSRAGNERVSVELMPHGLEMSDPRCFLGQLASRPVTNSPARRKAYACRSAKPRYGNRGGRGSATGKACIRLLSIIFLISSVVAAQAQQSVNHVFLTADQLLAMCSLSGYTPENPSPAAMLYLMGVVDSEAVTPSRSHDPFFCVPDGVGQSTLARTVCRYVQDHTNKGTYTAASVTYEALRSGFPCF